jgi:SAM-dependent methyltransferase
MFVAEIVAFREFYAAATGETVAVALNRAILRFWPECGGDTVVALGFALPFLEPLRTRRAEVFSFMPAAQGAMSWPQGGQPGRVALVQEHLLPLRSSSVNRLLVPHLLEHSRTPGKLLEELWRVLVPGGRALILVPNRHGVWSRAAATPFGCGQPYTLQQIGKRLGLKRFTVRAYRTCLFAPPVQRRWVRRLAPLLERTGEWLCPESGGVIIIEVEKQLYASIPEPVRERETQFHALPLPANALTQRQRHDRPASS